MSDSPTMKEREPPLQGRAKAEHRLLKAAREYRMEVLPSGDEEEVMAAQELDAALSAYDAICPLHGGYDPDQRGPGWCPYCVTGGKS